jgi:small conductance mechanosensitive channel
MGEELQTVQKIYDVVAEFLINYSFQIIGAIIILLIGGKLAGWLGRIVGKFCEEKGLNLTLARFLGNAVKVLVLVFVVITAVAKFGISIAPFVAALGAMVFGGSFALAGPLSNYGAGLVIILSRPFIIGNTITVQGVNGVVEEIRLAATILTTEDGELITIPNKHIVGEVLRNSFANKVVETRVGIAYEDDPEAAIEAISKVLGGIAEVCGDPSPQVGIENFGDSAIEIGMRYWVPTKKYFQTLYRVNLGVHKALAEAGITIPFPQRDVHLVEKAGSEQGSRLNA